MLNDEQLRALLPRLLLACEKCEGAGQVEVPLFNCPPTGKTLIPCAPCRGRGFLRLADVLESLQCPTAV